MGVQGLWEVLQPAGQSRSLRHLAVVDGLEKNASEKRAYRIGVDASLWFQHSYSSKGGENPQLRLLFFRLARLSELPLIPLFVFDGRERPKVKRGSKKGKAGSHALTDGFKRILGHFGYEWRTAIGEAEAELAYLNRIGVVDAVLTDDVDAFIFGARVVIKNWSKDLSGNRSKPALNKDEKESKHHVMIFNVNDIQTHPSVGLTRGGLILFALLKGGDYDGGIEKVGEKIARGLARCGFGDQLLAAYERRAHQPVELFLAQWRIEMNAELRTNSRGLLPHRVMSVTIPNTFPDLEVLENYANPKRATHHVQVRDVESMDLPRIARFCEDSFEWGYKAKILYRFRTVLWEACVMRVLRRAAMEMDEKEKSRRIANGGGLTQAITGSLTPSRAETIGTSTDILHRYLRNPDSSVSSSPSVSNSIEDRRRAAFLGSARRAAAPDPASALTGGPPLLIRIDRTRQHVSTDHLLEYRVAIKPGPLVALASEDLTGKRPEPGDKAGKEYQVDSQSEMLMWVPASILRQVHPDLVEDWEAKGNKRGKSAAAREGSDEEGTEEEEEAVAPAPKRKRASRKSNASGGSQAPSSSPVRSQVHTSSQANSTAAGPSCKAAAPPPMSGPAGFLFSFANPDDPDVLEVDCDIGGGEGILDRFDMMFDQLMGSDPQFLAASASQGSQNKGKGRAVASSADLEDLEDCDIPSFDQFGAFDDPSNPFNQMFEQIMNGGKRKVAKGVGFSRRDRSSARGAVARNSARGRKRKTVADAAPPSSPAPDPVAPPTLPGISRFPDLPALTATRHAYPSPRMPSTPHSDGDVIEILSDSDVEVSATAPRAAASSQAARGQYWYPAASSSQDSSLSRYDGEVDIDLTV